MEVHNVPPAYMVPKYPSLNSVDLVQKPSPFLSHFTVHAISIFVSMTPNHICLFM